MAGPKPFPVGEDNCLAGLSFVFTGILETLSREGVQELVTGYGGKVTITPNNKTSFVVMGTDPGPSKHRKIAGLKLKAINEDGLFQLIRQMPATSKVIDLTDGGKKGGSRSASTPSAVNVSNLLPVEDPIVTVVATRIESSRGRSTPTGFGRPAPASPSNRILPLGPTGANISNSNPSSMKRKSSLSGGEGNENSFDQVQHKRLRPEDNNSIYAGVRQAGIQATLSYVNVIPRSAPVCNSTVHPLLPCAIQRSAY